MDGHRAFFVRDVQFPVAHGAGGCDLVRRQRDQRRRDRQRRWDAERGLGGARRAAAEGGRPTMTAGQQYSVSVTMRNEGGTTWTPDTNYRLGSANPYDNIIWGMNRVGLDAGDSMAVGQEKTFTWTLRAPATPGQYNFQWRMVQDGVMWFGPSSTNTVVSVQ